ncbi:MAG: hypothetical protein N3B18_01070 [Desulfobacterota bacterium]|nr:hypothetical protein [Thermodesulfobacteriota bacterium]
MTKGGLKRRTIRQQPQSPELQAGQHDTSADILTRYPPAVVAALAAEVPDLFPDAITAQTTNTVDADTALNVELSSALMDEHIKTLAAYNRLHDDSCNDLPEIAREALRQFVILKKYLPTDEIAKLEAKVFAALRKRFGPFDESGLVMFLVKYLL